MSVVLLCALGFVLLALAVIDGGDASVRRENRRLRAENRRLRALLNGARRG